MKDWFVMSLAVCIGLHAVAREYEDHEIAAILEESNRVIDASGRAGRMVEGAFDYACHSDTSRFCRIIADMATTNDARLACWMVTLLGAYGGREQLPLLYSLATNADTCVSACKSMVRIEGLTTNSLAAIGACLAVTNLNMECRSRICRDMLMYVRQNDIVGDVRENALGRVMSYAASANRYVREVDESLSRTDPTYQNSKRRLAVLRSAHALGVSQYQINYVTNAINELVAYPESALPE